MGLYDSPLLTLCFVRPQIGRKTYTRFPRVRHEDCNLPEDGGNDFGILVQRGRAILERLRQAMDQQKAPDAFKALFRLLLSAEEREGIDDAVDSWKSLSGLGPLREPLFQWIQWYNDCDHLFTEARCRTDRRAKKFVRLRKKLDDFLDGKISADQYLLAVHEQLSLLQALDRSPPKKKQRSKPHKPKPRSEQIRGFGLRKALQACTLGTIVFVVILLRTFDLSTGGLSFGVAACFHLIASLFDYAQFRIPDRTRRQRILKSLLIASYVLVFAAPTYQYVTLMHQVDLYFFLLLIVLLFSTEILFKQSRMELIDKLAEYVERIGTVAVFVGAAYGLSLVLGEAIWIGMSILAALWAAWNNTRQGN